VPSAEEVGPDEYGKVKQIEEPFLGAYLKVDEGDDDYHEEYHDKLFIDPLEFSLVAIYVLVVF
jgi:hypothetical protein